MGKTILKEALMAIVILLLGIAVLYLGSILYPEENNSTNNTVEEIIR